MTRTLVSFLLAVSVCISASAVPDTLRVMTYNVLYYGDVPACQAPHDTLHSYLKTIVSYANPDILGLVKAETFPVLPGDRYGSAPVGFPDSILRFALNAAFPSRYAYCPATNYAHADDMQLLFFNQQKLAYVGIVANYVKLNDFTTYKFYYKSAGLAMGQDTVFLYVVLNHTESGGGAGSTAIRATQIDATMNKLDSLFTTYPNVINMGDFNFRNANEAGYKRIVDATRAPRSMYDPPFYPDATYTYPADWDGSPGSFASELTTSTRLTSVPNGCGSTGGGKSWYDHIFISRPIVDNTLGLKYISGSYQTIGNDGRRVGKSINDSPTNTAAPPEVINALFRMSNKYPVMVQLLVTPDAMGVGSTEPTPTRVVVENPVLDFLRLRITGHEHMEPLQLACYDAMGGCVMRAILDPNEPTQQLSFGLPSGVYLLQLSNRSGFAWQQVIIKQ
jgi:hypothetical protein